MNKYRKRAQELRFMADRLDASNLTARVLMLDAADDLDGIAGLTRGIPMLDFNCESTNKVNSAWCVYISGKREYEHFNVALRAEGWKPIPRYEKGCWASTNEGWKTFEELEDYYARFLEQLSCARETLMEMDIACTQVDCPLQDDGNHSPARRCTSHNCPWRTEP
jgi:hypothetical protein